MHLFRDKQEQYKEELNRRKRTLFIKTECWVGFIIPPLVMYGRLDALVLRPGELRKE